MHAVFSLGLNKSQKALFLVNAGKIVQATLLCPSFS